MKQGFYGILPFAVGAAAYGFAFGILAAQSGYPWWGVALMSLTVHAGSSQIVAIERFGADGLVIGAAIAGIALNLRYLGIIASLSALLQEIPLWRRLVAIHITGDENWALTLARHAADPAIGAAFLIGSGLTMITGWTLSTTLGALFGQSMPDLASYGLGFAFTAAFIAMARAMWRGLRNVVPWAVTFAVTVLLVKAGVESAYAILLASLVGVAMAALLRRRQKKLESAS
ncbi:MAG: branched-chain amino acid permease [Sneathiella sp.]|jgi:4-azaleucine resistance transporter AzlC|uniref:AzlC family ABC transporter permease n=1 Tax=Sneathiella sp. TaxID=1964365 RepID=UPI000C550A92|nr:AzlC family ABC transporter permease [Sneathiella sp.]MAL80242.1 branched-chain amino acid permease [Sneathiella sp.]|tara:strand:- start:264 stop:953 length:690 start_codon:yes stop_codon:yes gene_type:complete